MPIRDNPSFRETEQTVRAFAAMAKLRPLFRYLGKSGRSVAEALDAVPGLQHQFEALAAAPDAFNARFRERGWIAYEAMNHEVMQHAIELADAGDFDAGERLLVEYFDRDTIASGLRRLRRIQAFHIREDLLISAVDDHVAGRFHASVPVVLAQLDGIAYDLTNNTIYGREPERLTNVIVEDSIAGHDEGVALLIATVFGLERGKTTTEQLTTPHRHGILHGRDIGYANELVSTKCFALLLAFGSVAVRIEAERLKALSLVKPDEAEPPSWGAIWRELKALNERRERTFLAFPQAVSGMRDRPDAVVDPCLFWIPGFRVRRLAGKLQYLGFEWKPPMQGATMLYWSGGWKSAIADYEVSITGADADHIRSANAIFFNYSHEPTASQATDFLGFIATIPYENARPDQAQQWVLDQVAAVEGGHEASAAFGGATFALFGNERTRTLQITGLGPDPDLGPRPPSLGH
ncbi:hypothetical protein BH23CHL2_BH23CHL2_24240 [soil metagenome]